MIDSEPVEPSVPSTCKFELNPVVANVLADPPPTRSLEENAPVVKPERAPVPPRVVTVVAASVEAPAPNVPVVTKFSFPNVIEPLADMILPEVIVMSEAKTPEVVPANVVNVPAAAELPPMTAPSTVPPLMSTVVTVPKSDHVPVMVTALFSVHAAG